MSDTDSSIAADGGDELLRAPGPVRRRRRRTAAAASSGLVGKFCIVLILSLNLVSGQAILALHWNQPRTHMESGMQLVLDYVTGGCFRHRKNHESLLPC